VPEPLVTVAVNVTACPAVLGLADEVSAVVVPVNPVTEVETVAALLMPLESDVLLVTLAVLVNVEPLTRLALVCATNMKVAVAPDARLAQVAVEVLPPTSDALGPLDCATLTKVSPTGSASVIDAFCASLGPLLVTVIV